MEKYRLEKIEITEKYYEVFIKADSNDGDYVSTKTKYNQKEFDEIIDALIDIKNNYSGDHEFENYQNKYDLDIPYPECDGTCHTLEELSVIMYDFYGKMYNVIF